MAQSSERASKRALAPEEQHAGYHPGSAEDFDPPRPGLSWAALGAVACGIANFVILYPVGAILALLLGYGAKRTIARSGGVQTGLRVAWLGILLGWVGLAINIYTFIAFNVFHK